MLLYELWKPWRRFGLVCSDRKSPQITANHRKSPQEAAAAVHVDWNEAAVSLPLSPPQ